MDLPKYLNGDWLFTHQMGENKALGFIYVIRDNYMKMFYLGKKNYFVRRGKNKGAPSDWRRYKSSQPTLKEIMAARPKDEFDFIVLDEYVTSTYFFFNCFSLFFFANAN